MTRYLTDTECGHIVAASLDPDRVLGGPDGHEGGEPDVLLTTVEQIIRRHRASELREAANEFGVNERTEAGVYVHGSLLDWADQIEADDE